MLRIVVVIIGLIPIKIDIILLYGRDCRNRARAGTVNFTLNRSDYGANLLIILVGDAGFEPATPAV